MDEMKSKDAAYSGERAPVAPMSAAAEVRVRVAPIENAGGAGPTENLSAVASILEIAKASLPGSLGQVAAFLKRTKRVWLMTAGIVIGVAGLVNLSARAAEWAKNARERRQLHAMATLTPESLFARCGAAVVDETKVVYPVLMRTISYHPRGGETLLVSFSRTAEEKSDWVFLSMQNENGTAIYDTPETKIAALPCLDSMKQ